MARRLSREAPAANDDLPPGPPAPEPAATAGGPGAAERAWLRRGLGQPGGKLPLFDGEGQRVDPRLVRGCLERGWAEPWFDNPLKPDWLVCKLTAAGREAAR